MPKVLKEKIMLPAWEIIKDDSKIKTFYILPWLLSILFLTILLVYQSIYTYVELFWNKEAALEIILKFFHSQYIIETVVWIVIFLIIYFILTPIFEWWLIKYIELKDKKTDISKSEAFGYWLYNFFPLFEFNNMFSEFKIISIINWFLFMLRFFWIEYLKILIYVFIVLLFLAIILNILFSYSKYIIVLEKKWVFESIWLSAKITLFNLTRTIKLYFLMLFLNMRVIFNFIIFLSFPLIIVIAIWLISSKIFLIMAIVILSILFILFIAALWYLTAVLEVFTTAIWYYAYKEGKARLEEDLNK